MSYFFGGKMLITNNPRFKDAKNMDVIYMKKDCLEVFIKARDFIHKGYKLITHPLYGNFRVDQMFYRSVALEKNDKIDLQSLELIENAISRLYGKKVSKRYVVTEKMRDDFSYIDYEIISEALERGGTNV